jgi:hypothetical protein
MPMPTKVLVCLLGAGVISVAMIDGAHAGRRVAIYKCESYGFIRGTRAFHQCRMNVRQYWTTGPCGDPFFAVTHRGYCHLYPPLPF